MKVIRFAPFFLLLLAACYPPKTQQDTEAAKNCPVAARFNLVFEPQSLDPRKARDLNSVSLIRALFEGLTRINSFEKPELALAESVLISQDLKTYTFKLRKSRWNNGDPLTAHDFVYAWKKVLDPFFSADNAFQLYVVKGAKSAKTGLTSLDEVGVRALSDYELEVQLENPTPYFLDLIAFPAFFPVNHKVDEENPQWSISSSTFVSNGPFSLGEWEHQHLLTLVKNGTYWDAKTVQLEEVHFAMVPNETEFKMFEKKELDWTGSPFSTLPVDALAHLKKQEQLNAKPLLGTYFLRSNTAHPLLSNTKLRKALALAINRKEIVEHVTQGGQLPATGLVPTVMGLQENSYFSDGDHARAQELFAEFLAEMHLKVEELPSLKLIYGSGDRNHLLAQTLQQQWLHCLGIHIQLESMERKVFIDQISKKNYELASSDWIADFNDPINFLEVFKYQAASTNNTGWEDPEYVRLLDASSLEIDPERRKHILCRSEKLLMDAMPIIPIFQHALLYMADERLKDVVVTSMGVMDFKWAHIQEGAAR